MDSLNDVILDFDNIDDEWDEEDATILTFSHFLPRVELLEEKVRVIRPEASELYKIEKKHLIRYVNIGPPMDKRYGTEPVVQLNDQFSNPMVIQDWIAKERTTLAEAEQSKMWVSLKVDKDTKMGVVTEVKQELRKASALKVLYSASSRKRTGSAE